MTPVTLDASVVCKWYLDPATEQDASAAQAIALAVRNGELLLVQPPHWLAEVGAVVTRMLPAHAEAILGDLHDVGVVVADQRSVYRRAARLSIDTGAHLFDALYHAVALETPGCRLITADERYARLAGRHRRVTLLNSWRP